MNDSDGRWLWRLSGAFLIAVNDYLPLLFP
jgi:hypothetical protein